MPTFNPRIFTNADRLRSISPDHLLSFLGKWSSYFKGRGLDLTAATQEAFPYDGVAAILMQPDKDVPEEMVDALFYVHETANNESMDELLARAESAGIELSKDRRSTTADVSVQIWLAEPLLLQRQHAETVAFERSNFIYFAGSRPKDRRAEVPTITEILAAAIQENLNDWFESHRRGRNCRIFAFPREKKVWLLVRHGMPMRREGKHQEEGEGGIAFYQPQQHDVLIYDGETDEIGVNAGTKGERELFLESLGEALFGSKTYFVRSSRYWLNPLLETGPKSMVHEDIEGLARVRFVEFGRTWRGAVSETEVRKADDLFRAYGDKWQDRLRGGSLTHASFKFEFVGSKRQRSVTIRPPNIARYERESDEEVIEAWLKARGFWSSVEGADGGGNFDLLEGA